MDTSTPALAAPSVRIPTRALLASALLFVLALALDRWAFEHVAVRDVYGSDLGRLLRVAGFVPTWLLGAAALALYDRGLAPAPAGGRLRRAGLLLLAPILGGLVAEVLKLLLRRERPGPHDGAYVFRSFMDQPWSTKALGLPSSHAMVAFAGAAMASYLFPRTAPVWILWAVACGWTRVAARAHFLSDVALAAIGGWLVARTLVVVAGRREAGRAAAEQTSVPPSQQRVT